MPKSKRQPTRLKVNLKRLIRCATRKIGFATKGQALDVAELMMEQGHVSPGCHITPYECDECGQWHVSNRVIVPVSGSVPLTNGTFSRRPWKEDR